MVPNPTAIAMAHIRVFLARSGFPAPKFCAAKDETAASIEEGIKKNIPITFSTIPTAAASAKPLLFAKMVIIRNDI